MPYSGERPWTRTEHQNFARLLDKKLRGMGIAPLGTYSDEEDVVSLAFIDLTDCPHTYDNSASQVVYVSSTEDGLLFCPFVVLSAADAILTIRNFTDSVVDPLLQFALGATPVVKFTIGVDDSDADALKIVDGTSLSGDDYIRYLNAELVLQDSSAQPVFKIINASGSARDPVIQWAVGASPATKYTMGVDDSDEDAFVIETGDELGGADAGLTRLSLEPHGSTPGGFNVISYFPANADGHSALWVIGDSGAGLSAEDVKNDTFVTWGLTPTPGEIAGVVSGPELNDTATITAIVDNIELKVTKDSWDSGYVEMNHTQTAYVEIDLTDGVETKHIQFHEDASTEFGRVLVKDSNITIEVWDRVVTNRSVVQIFDYSISLEQNSTDYGEVSITCGAGEMALVAPVSLTVNSPTTTILTGQKLRFQNPAGTFSAGFKAGTMLGDVTWILPLADSVGTQALVSDGAGNLDWLTVVSFPEYPYEDAILYWDYDETKVAWLLIGENLEIVGGVLDAVHDFSAYSFNAISGDNMILNGEFDTDTSDWVAENTAALASIAGGTYGNCLRVQENGTTDPYAKQGVGEFVVGHSYRISVYVKQGTESTYTVEFWMNSVNEGMAASAEATDEWVEQTFDIIATDTYGSIYLICNASFGAGTNVLFDDIWVSELPAYYVDGIKGVLPTQQSHVEDPTGGDVVDAEARSAIESILSALETSGIFASV